MSPKSVTMVAALRNALPYINAHRGRIFIVSLSGATLQKPNFPHLVHDLALLNSLGARLVLAHGARPNAAQIHSARPEYAHGLRVTDSETLEVILAAVGSARARIEGLFSLGLANSPMAGARLRVVSGNFILARPLGVRHGIDYQHTGEVRRVDTDALRRHLEAQEIVLLPPLGYSPTGEIFHLSAEAVATATAIELNADKLIFFIDGTGIHAADGKLIAQLNVDEAMQMIDTAPESLKGALTGAVQALRRGVGRAHLISHDIDGALLLELFTRDGHGTLIDRGSYDSLRVARIEDVGGILALITPLETEGVLVRRSRERLENEIDYFVVAERDGAIIGCAALYPFPDERAGELACLAVHPDYRRQRRGELLLNYLEQHARQLQLQRLFVLTTHASHWFQERGFITVTVNFLPVARQALYNWQRNSKILVKSL